MKTFVSDLSGKRFPEKDKVSGKSVRLSIMELIRSENPSFDVSGNLSRQELNAYRERYISAYLQTELGDLGALDRKVLGALKSHSLVSRQARTEQSKLTAGQRIADRVASFGGSWTFIIIFICILFAWVFVNAIWLGKNAFDPYPFILMNLVLSCLAAFQAPIIMMSQNRQAVKDRQHAENDYIVNLKSEIEIRSLHEKVDHLMIFQQQELIEIQKVQIDMLTDLQKELADYKKEKKAEE